jgi:hypothetical protein
MSIFTVAGRKKLEDDEIKNYLLEEKNKLEGIQANIELLKKRGNYDASIILQSQLNDMMGISNTNLDTSQAERDIGNLLKKNIETSLNANKKINGITTKVEGIEELKKEIEKDKEINANEKAVKKKKKLATINSNLKTIHNKQSLNAFGNKLKRIKAQANGEETLTDRFLREQLFSDEFLNNIDGGITGLKNRTIEPDLIVNISNDIEEVSRIIPLFKSAIRENVDREESYRLKRKIASIELRIKSLKGKLNTQKQKPLYSIYFGLGPADVGGAEEHKGEEQPPPPPPPPIYDPPVALLDAQIPELEGHGLPRMYSLLRKKATKKGRGIAMQEVLSNFHHKPLYFNTKVKKARQIILKDEKEKLENLINKYDILTGEILAGNNNKQLLIQLKSLITRLVNLKKLDSDVAHEVLQQLQLIK